MSGKSSSTTNQNQNQTTNPWQPTIGPLNTMISQITGQMGQTGTNPQEQNAFSQMLANYLGMDKSLGQSAESLSKDLLTGGPDRSGYITGAWGANKEMLNPYMSASYLDPRTAPGMSDVLSTIRNDVSNNVNSLFAGAGRDLSGKHAESLARGLSSGMAMPLLNQYNQNVQTQLGAGRQLFDMGTGAASALGAQDQQRYGNRMQGIDIGMHAPEAGNAPWQGVLDINNAMRSAPLNNMSNILSLLLPIAGLGGQSVGTGTSTTTSKASPLQTILGIGTMLSKFLPSDRKLKRDIEMVGKLNDGTPIYRYRYIGQNTYHIGLMADEVKPFAPEAVVRKYGYDMVDYKLATERAVRYGSDR